MNGWVEGALVPALHARSRFGDNGMSGGRSVASANQWKFTAR